MPSLQNEPESEKVPKIITELKIQEEKLDKEFFTVAGEKKFKSKISNYEHSLFAESKRIAKISKVEIISSSHVDIASENLMTTPKNKLMKLLGLLGGILLGAALSNILSTNEAALTYSLFIKTVLCVLVGCIFLLIGYRHSK